MFGIRKLYFAAPVVVALVQACSASEVLEPAPAELAKGGGSGSGGFAHWIAGTGYDFATQTFAFRAAGLGKNQSLTIGVAADLTVSYDCANEQDGIYTANAHAAVRESITGSQMFFTSKSGNVDGAVSLNLEAQGSLRCDAGLTATNLQIHPGGTVRVNVTPAMLPGLAYSY